MRWQVSLAVIQNCYPICRVFLLPAYLIFSKCKYTIKNRNEEIFLEDFLFQVDILYK